MCNLQPERLTIADYDPQWSVRFAKLGGRLRTALGEVALWIDHIGSTARAQLGGATTPMTKRQSSDASFSWPTNGRNARQL